jgi:hypothetical protein
MKLLSVFLLSTCLTLTCSCSQLQKGASAQANGDLEAAQTAYEEAIKQNPQDALAHNNLGLVYLQQKNYTKALAQFDLALQADPQQPLARSNQQKAYAWLAHNGNDSALRAQAQNWLAAKQEQPKPSQIVLAPTALPTQTPMPAPLPSPTPQPELTSSPVLSVSPSPATVTLTSDQIQKIVDAQIEKRLNSSAVPENKASAPVIMPENMPITGQKFALVIGVSKYGGNTGYRELPSAADDARKVHQYLIAEGGFRPEQTHLLLNEQATADNIRKELKQFLRNSANSPDDIVFIYYSGHGDLVDRSEAYIVPFGVEKRNLVSQGMPLEEFSSGVQKLKSQKVAMFIDSCHSGSILQGVTTKGESQSKLNISDNFLRIASKGRLIMTSSAENESSLELEGKGGLFTLYLLKGLRGEADLTRDRQITVKELYEYIRRNVEREAREITNQPQSVQRSGELEGVLVELKK